MVKNLVGCFAVALSCLAPGLQPSSVEINPQEDKKCTVDEALRDTSLVAARNALLEAIRSRDAQKISPFISDDIYLSTDSSGRDAMTKIHRLDRRNSPIWSDLEQILTNGGKFEI